MHRLKTWGCAAFFKYVYAPEFKLMLKFCTTPAFTLGQLQNTMLTANIRCILIIYIYDHIFCPWFKTWITILFSWFIRSVYIYTMNKMICFGTIILTSYYSFQGIVLNIHISRCTIASEFARGVAIRFFVD